MIQNCGEIFVILFTGILRPGPDVVKLFLSLIYECRVFVPVKPFQLSLMFVGKTGACPIEEPSDAPLYGRLLTMPTNNRLDWDGLPGTDTLAYYENS